MTHLTHILIVVTETPERAVVHISGHASCLSAERKADAISRKSKVNLFATIFEAAFAPAAWQFVTNLAL